MAEDPLRVRAAAHVNEEFQIERQETLQRQEWDTARLAGIGKAERNAFNRQRSDMEIAHASQWKAFEGRKESAGKALTAERNTIRGRLRSLTDPRYFERKEAALNTAFGREQRSLTQTQVQQAGRLDQQQQEARLRYGSNLKAMHQQHRDERAGQQLRQEASRELRVQQKTAALQAEKAQTQTQTSKLSRDFSEANQGRSHRR